MSILGPETQGARRQLAPHAVDMALRIITGSLLRTVRAGIAALERELMPRSCPFCGTELEAFEPACCSGCMADLPWNDHQCPRCAEPLATPSAPGVDCAACQQSPPPFRAAVAPLRYTFPVDAAIRKFKFQRKLHYVPAFGAILASALSALPGEADALLPVPLHWRRHAARGFNQARELCGPIRRQTGLPIIHDVRRVRATQSQSGLRAEARRRNLAAAFAIRGELTSQHVVIVDDVITTGATCRQLANVVLAAGAKRVSVLALARASAND